jgi:phospholipid/cholesterol/gamma-HCH transport system substrate-binding protein
MRRSRPITWEEVKVGVVLIGSLVLLAAGVFFIGNTGSVFGERYQLVTLMHSAAGLVPGAAVQLAGQPVGQVSRISFISPENRPASGEGLEVWVAVNRGVQDQIRSDSRARIRTMGLLGDRIIDIEPGSPDTRILEPGDTLAAAAVLDYSELLDEASSAVVSLTRLVRSLDELTQDLLAGEGTVGQLFVNRDLYDQLVNLSGDLSSLLRGVNAGEGTLGRMAKDDELYDRVVNAVASLDSMTAKLARGEGSLGRLIESDSLYRSLAGAASRSDSLIAGLRAGEGSIGQLIVDETLYEELLRMVVELNNILSDLRAQPDKYLPPITVF